MKKIVFALAALLALCICAGALVEANHEHRWTRWEHTETEHWYVCQTCGQQIEREKHWAFCNEPTVCRVCGLTAADGIVIDQVYHSAEDYTHTATQHWAECKLCGEKLNLENHWAYCTAPDKCAVCGLTKADGITLEGIFHEWENYDHDAASHWYTCKRCGNKFQNEKHWASCASPNVCAACGLSAADGIVIDKVNHSADKWSTSKEEHCQICSLCGQVFNREAHWADCLAPTTCKKCGLSAADGITIATVYHSWEGYQHNATEHWTVCDLCHNTFNKEDHWVSCADPTHCAVCGIPFTGEIVHVNNDPAAYQPYDDTYHQFVCENCRQTIKEAHHFHDGICVTCNYRKGTEPTTAPTATATAAATATATTAPTATATAASPTPTTAPTPTGAPAPKAKYTAEATFSKKDRFLQGTATHVEGTDEVKRLYARITYFFADGTYNAGAVSIVDGEFESMTSGDVIHVGIQVVDSVRVRPGSYNRFGGTEFDVN